MTNSETNNEILLERLDRIDQLLGQMSDSGEIGDEYYTQLCDLIHRDPSEWPEVPT